MRICWFVKKGKTETKLCETVGELPRVGDEVFFHDSTKPKAGERKKFVVKSSYHRIMMGELPFDAIEYPADMRDGAERFDFAYDFVREKCGGEVNNWDADKRVFIYSHHEGEVIVEEVREGVWQTNHA